MAFGFGRIEYDGNVIDLQRPWTSFQPRKPVSSDTRQAQSGIEQTAKFFSQHFIDTRLNLLSPQEKSELLRLFEFAEGGDSFTLIRDRNLGAYINFEGGINPTAAPRGLKTNDDVDGTFTRALTTDSAWYLDEGTGLLTVRDVVDQPRFPAGKFGAGIQMDGAAVNLITNRISNAAWIKTTMTAATTTETLDPAGNNSNVDKLTATAASATAKFTTGTPKGNEAAGKFWIKSSSGNVSLNLTIETTTVITNAVTATPVWTELKVQGDTSALAAGNLKLGIEIVTNGEIVYVWHTPQLFDSAEFDLGTVGPLSTSSITRNLEKLNFASSNIMNRDKGTILMWVKPRWASNKKPATVFFDSGDSAGATANRHVVFYHLQADGLHLETNKNNGATAAFAFSAAASLTQDSYNFIGGTWDATISNGHKLYLGGSLIGTSINSPYNISETGDTFAIGSEIDGDNPDFCAIDEVLITRNVLTAADFAGIFNLGIGLGVPRNRWTVKLADQTWNPRWLNSDVYDIPLLLKEVLT